MSTISRKCSIHQKKYRKKPNQAETVTISNNLVATEITSEALHEHLTNGGSWSPGVYKNNKRKKANFISADFLALDFDGGQTPDSVRERLELFDLEWSFFHPSFSDSPECRKFRVIFELEQTITDSKVLEQLNKLLINIFESDQACKDASRLFFGGTSDCGADFNKLGVLSTELVYLAAKSVNASRVSDNNISASNRRFGERFSEIVNFAGNSHSTYKYIRAVNNSCNFEQIAPPLPQNFDLTSLIDESKILQAFETGVHENGDRFHYYQILGLIFNLQYFTGGLKWMKAQIEKHAAAGIYPFTNPSYYKAIFSDNKSYLPCNLANFSPYPEDHFGNLVQQARDLVDQRMIPLPNRPDPISLEEGEALLTKAFADALAILDGRGSGMIVIKTPTGLGKTRLINEYTGAATVASPTHALKSESFERAQNATPDTVFVGETGWTEQSFLELKKKPVFPEDIYPENVIAEMRTLQARGDNEGASNVATKYAEKHFQGNDEASLIHRQYVKELRGINSNNHKRAYTTTASVLNGTCCGNDLIIFDEDIVKLTYCTHTFDTADLWALENSDDICGQWAQELGRQLKEAKDGHDELELPRLFIPVPDPAFTTKEWEAFVDSKGDKIKGNVRSMPFCKYIALTDERVFTYVDITRAKDLSTKKSIVFSATANHDIYKAAFKDSLIDFFEIPEIKIAGEIYQDSRYSYSKASLSRPAVQNRANTLISKYQIAHTITHKDSKNKLPNQTELHFGNCSGYDFLKGSKLAVVGTPFCPHQINALYCLAFFDNIQDFDRNLIPDRARRTVEINGYRVPRMFTYENERLRMIETWLIESEVMQAVGRARVLREKNAKVLVMSNYPVSQHKPA